MLTYIWGGGQVIKEKAHYQVSGSLFMNCWSRRSHGTPPNSKAIDIALGYLPELNDKTIKLR